MNKKLKITANQVDYAISIIEKLKRECKRPKARFETDCTDWWIEVEYLEGNGVEKLRYLKEFAEQSNNYLTLTVLHLTNNRKQNQYYIEGFKNSTYAVNTTVRDMNKVNIIRRRTPHPNKVPTDERLTNGTDYYQNIESNNSSENMLSPSELKNYFIQNGANKIDNKSDLPKFYGYLIISNGNILAIGKAGRKQRIDSFFKGTKGQNVHTKAFVVAMGHAIWGEVEIYLKEAKNAEQALSIEKDLSCKFGGRKLFISDAPEKKELFESSEYLWKKLVEKRQINPSNELKIILPLLFDNGDVLKSVLRRDIVVSQELNNFLDNFFLLKRI